MAQRRAFSLAVIDTDAFQDMPMSSQALYFHLGMHGDDDGFVSSPKKIARAAGCGDDDIKLLIAKGFVIAFESGVIVIRDWRINNSLKNDRYHETLYQEEKSMLILDKANRYQLGNSLEPSWNQLGSKVEPEHNLTEHNEESMAPPTAVPAPTKVQKPKITRREYGQFGWVKLSDEEYSRLSNDLGEPELERCIRYVDESAQSTGNKNRWRDWNLVIRRCHRDGWGLAAAREGVSKCARADSQNAVGYTKLAVDPDGNVPDFSNW